jgi:acetyl esterase/lipase
MKSFQGKSYRRQELRVDKKFKVIFLNKNYFMRSFTLSIFLFFSFIHCLTAQDTLSYTTNEIIYGRKDGMALTMIRVVPKNKPNGKGIISVVSGNWISSYENAFRFINRSKVYLDNGYTVFAVMHGSQPRYTIPEEISDIKRAVRFIRFNSKDLSIDGKKLGITGSSSGGHLSLMVGLSDDKIDTSSKDPVDRVSSRVQAVAVFYPPVDFLNWGQDKMDLSKLQAALAIAGVAAAFDFKEWDSTSRLYKQVTPESKLEIARRVSPIYHVTPDDPPVFLIHGDADRTVPVQQSLILSKKLKEINVPNELIIKKDGGHSWRNREIEEKNFLDWFDKYLR